jgi:hypothetical protein
VFKKFTTTLDFELVLESCSGRSMLVISITRLKSVSPEKIQMKCICDSYILVRRRAFIVTDSQSWFVRATAGRDNQARRRQIMLVCIKPTTPPALILMIEQYFMVPPITLSLRLSIVAQSKFQNKGTGKKQPGKTKYPTTVSLNRFDEPRTTAALLLTKSPPG